MLHRVQNSGEKRCMPQKRPGLRGRLFLLALLLCAGALAVFALAAPAGELVAVPPPIPTPKPRAGEAPAAIPAPSAAPAVSPAAPAFSMDVIDPPVTAWDFSQTAEESFPVEDSYFSDALFLGDSRSDGLRLYSGIRGADFLAYPSLMVFHTVGTGGVGLQSVPINGTGPAYTVPGLLNTYDYGKVYIMFGINELDYRDERAFRDAFVRLVASIRQQQPGAIIYIQSLIPVCQPKVRVGAWMNNENIAAYNAVLRQVATEAHAVYVDVREAMVDDTGALPDEATPDGVHFTRTWYRKWYDYLKTHTVDKAAYDRGLLAVGDLGTREGGV